MKLGVSLVILSFLLYPGYTFGLTLSQLFDPLCRCVAPSVPCQNVELQIYSYFFRRSVCLPGLALCCDPVDLAPKSEFISPLPFKETEASINRSKPLETNGLASLSTSTDEEKEPATTDKEAEIISTLSTSSTAKLSQANTTSRKVQLGFIENSTSGKSRVPDHLRASKNDLEKELLHSREAKELPLPLVAPAKNKTSVHHDLMKEYTKIKGLANSTVLPTGTTLVYSKNFSEVNTKELNASSPPTSSPTLGTIIKGNFSSATDNVEPSQVQSTITNILDLVTSFFLPTTTEVTQINEIEHRNLPLAESTESDLEMDSQAVQKDISNKTDYTTLYTENVFDQNVVLEVSTEDAETDASKITTIADNDVHADASTLKSITHEKMDPTSQISLTSERSVYTSTIESTNEQSEVAVTEMPKASSTYVRTLIDIEKESSTVVPTTNSDPSTNEYSIDFTSFESTMESSQLLSTKQMTENIPIQTKSEGLLESTTDVTTESIEENKSSTAGIEEWPATDVQNLSLEEEYIPTTLRTFPWVDETTQIMATDADALPTSSKENFSADVDGLVSVATAESTSQSCSSCIDLTQNLAPDSSSVIAFNTLATTSTPLLATSDLVTEESGPKIVNEKVELLAGDLSPTLEPIHIGRKEHESGFEKVEVNEKVSELGATVAKTEVYPDIADAKSSERVTLTPIHVGQQHGDDSTSTPEESNKKSGFFKWFFNLF